jgi:hypothetical protein
MSESKPIGLAELIEQVKAELLAPPTDTEKAKTAPFLFVESVELELQVTVKRDAKAGVKVDVVSVAGVDAGSSVGQDKIQKVKVKLSPLYEKEEIKQYYKDLKPDQVLPSINNSLKVLKGEGEESADETMPDN